MSLASYLILYFLMCCFLPLKTQNYSLIRSEFCNNTFGNSDIYDWMSTDPGPFSTLVSDCGSYHLFGGYLVFSSNYLFYKNYTDLPPHYNLNISLNFMKIDLWSGNYIEFETMYATNISNVTKNYTPSDSQTNICGNSLFGEYLDFITFSFDHTDSYVVFGWETDASFTEYYGISNLTISGLLCDYTCENCTGPNANQCSQCYPNSQLTISNECFCLNQYYLVLHSPCIIPPCSECLACDVNCNECTGPLDTDCVLCVSKIYNNTCMENCPNNTYISSSNPNLCVDNCNYNEYVDSSKTCTPCYSLCQTCNGGTNYNCTSCFGSDLLQNGTCVSSCESGYMGNSGSCLKCDSSCSSCNGLSSTDCLTCVNANFFLLNGACVAQCTSPYWGITANKRCVNDCGIGSFGESLERICKNCDSSCKTCNGITNYNCTSCFGSQLLEEGTCVESCTTGYFSDGLGQCLQCDSSCLICNGPAPIQCLSCVDSTLYLENNICVQSCTQNLFERDDTMTCEFCNVDNCTECNIKWNQCESCVNNYSLSNIGLCLKNVYIMGILETNGQLNNFTLNFDQNISLTDEEILKFIILEVENSLLTSQAYTYQIKSINGQSFSLTFEFNSNFTNETQFNLTLNEDYLISKYPNYRLNQTILSNELSPVLICPNNYMPQGNSFSCISIEVLNPQLSLTFNPIQINLKLFCISVNCIHSEDYLNNVFSNIEKNHNLTIQPTPPQFINYTLQLSESDDPDIILIAIFLNYKASVIGNNILTINFNETKTTNFNLNENQVSIKLMDYYLLDESTQAAINGTVKISNSGSLASEISMYLNSFLQSDSSFAFRTIMIIEYIYILRYIKINYPINALQMFQDKPEPSKLFLSKRIETTKSEKNMMTGFLELYEISPYFLNNFGEIIINFSIIFFASHVFNRLYSKFYPQIEKSHNVLHKIIKSIHETIVWSISIIYLSSNYLTLCYFSSLNLVFAPLKSPLGILNFCFGTVSFIGSVYVVIYIYLIIIIIKINVKSETSNKQSNKIIPEPQLFIQKLGPDSNLKNDLESSWATINHSSKTLIVGSKSKNESPKTYKNSISDSNHELNQNKKGDFCCQETTISTKNNQYERKCINDFLPAWKKKSMSKSLKLNQIIPMDPLIINNLEDTEKTDQNDQIEKIKRDEASNLKTESTEKRQVTIDEFDPCFNEDGMKSKNPRSHHPSWFAKIQGRVSKEMDIEIRGKKNWRDFFSQNNVESLVVKYDVLYNDFKQNTRISHFVVVFDMTRYLLIGIMVAFFENYGLVIISLLLALNTTFCIYLLISFPFKEKLKNILTILTELANLLATLGALIIAICDYQEIYDVYLRLNAGWLIVYANILLICILLLSFLFMVLQTIWKFCRDKTNNKKSECKVIEFMKNNTRQNFFKNKMFPEKNTSIIKEGSHAVISPCDFKGPEAEVINK